LYWYCAAAGEALADALADALLTLATTELTCSTVTLHCWDMAWMLTLSPYWLICTLPTSVCTAVWTQASLSLPTCVTDCARAGTAAANTMANIAANNITFFNFTSSFENCLYGTHFSTFSPQCQHRCHYLLPFS
jgi:hypothetical protein